MWPKLKPELLEPEELARPVEWEKYDGFGMYAFYPPIMFQYPRGLILYTKGELERMQKTYKTHEKTKIPVDSGIFAPKTVWPPPMSCRWEVSEDMKQEIQSMKFEEIRQKYPFIANAPGSPLLQKRLVPKIPSSWECDDTKGQSDEQILATLGCPMTVSRDGKQWRPSKLPALHSDGVHLIHPSWYYQPSTYIRYVNLNKGVCPPKKAPPPTATEDEEEEL